jgi:hypothetical protein
MNRRVTLLEVLAKDIGWWRVALSIGLIILTPLLQSAVLPYQAAIVATVPLYIAFGGFIGWYQTWLVKNKTRWSKKSVFALSIFLIAMSLLATSLFALLCMVPITHPANCDQQTFNAAAIVNMLAGCLYALAIVVKSTQFAKEVDDKINEVNS